MWFDQGFLRTWRELMLLCFTEPTLQAWSKRWGKLEITLATDSASACSRTIDSLRLAINLSQKARIVLSPTLQSFFTLHTSLCVRYAADRRTYRNTAFKR